MFDIGFWEIALIGVIALLVVGPERLPALARNVGLWVGRMRRYVAHVRDDIEREISAEEVRKLIETPSVSISEIDDAITETQSVFREAEDQLNEVQRDAESLENELETDEVDDLDSPVTEEKGEGPFSAGNSELLNPELDSPQDSPGDGTESDTEVTQSKPVLESSEEAGPAKP